MTRAPIIDYSDEACMFARWENIAFPVFGPRMPSVDGVTAVASHIEAHGKRVGKGKLTEITLLGADVRMPDARVRKVLDGMVPRLAPYYCCVAAVFEGDGFRGAMIRGLLTGFQLLGRLKYPHSVFGTVSECAQWISDQKVVDSELADIADATREIRSLGLQRGVLTGTATRTRTSLPAPFR
ncbi:MAG TPA: hypothetical protein VJR89_18945 [Polyangiales bacterium]|nr:hypothetical protein [Polyangiales bacterium]